MLSWIFEEKRTENPDIIIASIQLGYWSANESPRQVTKIQRLFDAGVDIVISHSPHIPQAIATSEAGNQTAIIG
jgi:poly-gamma-glutamate capsule biosynthesis protein CapA/YwtB (metallophosphatase superfamily)